MSKVILGVRKQVPLLRGARGVLSNFAFQIACVVQSFRYY
jgi:hypothetical protein